MSMRIGDLLIEKCNDCPAFSWAGENMSQGDMGWRCEFGAFNRVHDWKNVQIPELDCLLKKADIKEY